MDKRGLDALMVRVAHGDNEAFSRLYEETKRGVFAFAYTYLGNYADAEDAMQETYLAVKRSAALYRTGTDVRAWLFEIAKNRSLDELRKRKRRLENEAEETAAGAMTAEGFPALDLMTEILSGEEKEIVLLHAVWGYKHREIAEMKKLPLGTVTWKYKTAIEKLQKEWENA